MTILTHLTHSRLVLPLTEPFKVATRTATEAQNVLVRLISAEGIVGLGEAAPVAYVTGESVETVESALSIAADAIADTPTGDLNAMISRASDLIPSDPAARAALEMAMYDIWGKERGIALWAHFGSAEGSVTSDLTIPIVSAAEAGRKAAHAWAAGFRHLKIKVGDPDGIESDRDRLRAVSAAAPNAALRIDANQAFTADEAVAFIRSAADEFPRIELVEQPVDKHDIDALVFVRSKTGGRPPIFADESASDLKAVSELIRRDAIDGVNIKFMKSGLSQAIEIAALCRRRGIKLMIGCMLESRLSLTAACAFAAGTGWFDFVDIDAHHLTMPASNLHGGFIDDGSRLTPERRAPGWGVDDGESPEQSQS